MPSLIHLNGPPASGKSTLAAMHADRHPPTMALDLDRLQFMIGGWRNPAQPTHRILRSVGLAAADAHLANGFDVLIPQYLDAELEIEELNSVAKERGAAFLEVVLLPPLETIVGRFFERSADEWDLHVRADVLRRGGPSLLARMRTNLEKVVSQRAHVRLIEGADSVTASYALFENVVENFRVESD